jgi:hypothetical protein
MKRSWSWIGIWLAGVCLLLVSVGRPTRLPLPGRFEKPSIAGRRESLGLPPCSSLRILSRGVLGSRAGPQEFFLAPDVFWWSEDLDPVGTPGFEYRGPPGRDGDLGAEARLLVAMVATAAPLEGVNSASTPNFPGVAGRI